MVKGQDQTAGLWKNVILPIFFLLLLLPSWYYGYPIKGQGQTADLWKKNICSLYIFNPFEFCTSRCIYVSQTFLGTNAFTSVDLLPFIINNQIVWFGYISTLIGIAVVVHVRLFFAYLWIKMGEGEIEQLLDMKDRLYYIFKLNGLIHHNFTSNTCSN